MLNHAQDTHTARKHLKILFHFGCCENLRPPLLPRPNMRGILFLPFGEGDSDNRAQRFRRGGSRGIRREWLLSMI